MAHNPPSHPPRSLVPDDDLDSHICPVCDGDCTCTTSLKIMLTVPVLQKKKRGRPPNVPAPRKPLNPKSAAPGKLAKRASSIAPKNKARQNYKSPAARHRARPRQRRRPAHHDSDSESDVDMLPHPHSSRFPTFVSASAISSLESDPSSDLTSLSDADSDDSIQREEEHFIINDILNDKARLRRQLLGGDDPLLHKKKISHNNDWVIRPRKKSVGPSDAEMDVDTDATDDDDDEEDDADDDQDDPDDDPDRTTTAMSVDDPEDDTDTTHRRHYVGLATGWSEDDDESSLDADLFFANLSDSDSSSSDDDQPPAVSSPSRPPRLRTPLSLSNSMTEDPDQSDNSCTSQATRGPRRSGHRRRLTLESLPFEVAEGWDGGVVFTNGVNDGQGIVDLEFEADAERFVADSPSQVEDTTTTTDVSPVRSSRRRSRRAYMRLLHGPSLDPTDVSMSASDSDSYSEAGYLEEDAEGEFDGGDTTDEELVGDNDLPNARAMALFNLPMSVSAINPIQTVSPIVSPPAFGGIGRGRRRHRLSVSIADEERKWKKRWGTESPRAVDILAGLSSRLRPRRSDDDRSEKTGRRRASSSPGEFSSGSDGDVKTPKTPTGPRKGLFLPSSDVKQAIIGEFKKGVEVPSPHPRFKGKRRMIGGVKPFAVDQLLRKHLLQTLASVEPPETPAHNSPSTSSHFHGFSSPARSVIEDVLSSALSTPGGVVIEHHTHQAKAIDLDDVLEASFLDDSSDHAKGSVSSALPSAENDDVTDKDLCRWDTISVGAFRQAHTPSSSVDFGKAIKASPMTLLGGGSGGSISAPSSIMRSKGAGGKHAKRRQITSSSAMSSPLILPIGSGERTPNSQSPLPGSSSKTPPRQQHQQQQQKNKKELKKEKKKKKIYAGVGVQQKSHANHHHHFHHQHHPNSKTRGVSATQRTNFFAASVPPLNL